MGDINDYKLLVLVNKLKRESNVTYCEKLIRYFAVRSIPEDSKKYLEAADACMADVLIRKVGVGDFKLTPKGREQIPVFWRASVHGNLITTRWLGYVSLLISILALLVTTCQSCSC